MAEFPDAYGLDWLDSENGVQGATIITVNTFEDSINAGDGVTSLREAINEANATDDDVLIQLSEGIYTLTITGSNEDMNATGDLDISGNGKVAIVGNYDSQDTLINAEGLGDRVFDIKENANVKIANLTITGGEEYLGGAISNFGELTVKDSEFNNNTADFGGVIFNSGELVLLGDNEFKENEPNDIFPV